VAIDQTSDSPNTGSVKLAGMTISLNDGLKTTHATEGVSLLLAGIVAAGFRAILWWWTACSKLSTATLKSGIICSSSEKWRRCLRPGSSNRRLSTDPDQRERRMSLIWAFELNGANETDTVK
jgi:hypothetical protein